MVLLHDSTPIPIEGFQSDEPTSFWERFEQAFGQRSDEVFSDQLHPLTVSGYILKRPGDSSAEVIDRGNRTARSAFLNSVEYSLRDATDFLPFVGGFESRQDSFSDFFLDSLDAVEEEAVSPLNPAYRTAERLWWQELAEDRVLRYGLRPLGTAPYAFLSLRLKEADRPLLLGHIRYYFRNFADHRFELAVSLPLAHGVAMDVGTAYQFGQHAEEKKLVVKVFKPLKYGAIVHIGVELQQSPTMFAGISLPM